MSQYKAPDFRQYQTNMDVAKHLHRQMRGMDAMEYYDTLLEQDAREQIAKLRGKENVIGDAFERSINESERHWIMTGSPYFKVFPRIAAMLATVNLNIQASFCRLPYQYFAVLFPRGEWRPCKDGPSLLSVLMWESDIKGWFDETADRVLSLNLQFDREAEPGSGLETSLLFNQINNNDLLETQVFGDRTQMGSAATSGLTPEAFTEAVIRVCLSVCFFGVNRHELIAPEIPRRYVHVIQEARKRGDQARLDKLSERFRGRWMIGREIELPSPHVTVERDERDEDHEVRELTHSHMRRAHMRMQASGPRDNPTHELIFVAPTLVRPDLPWRDGYSVGYKITDGGW